MISGNNLWASTSTSGLALLIILNFLFMNLLQAQDQQSDMSLEDYMIKSMASSEEELSREIAAISEELQNLVQYPLDLNSDRIRLLSSLQLANDYQVNKLFEYRSIYGILLSVFELQFIEGWDVRTIRNVLPFVQVSANGNKSSGLADCLKNGRHQLICKAETILEQKAGYRAEDSSATEDGHYLGDRWRMYLRYDYNGYNHLKAGLRIEKDAGEPYLTSWSGNCNTFLPGDYISGHVFLNDFKWLKALNIGDYRLDFGQGLNLRSGQTFISGTSPVFRNGPGIKPHTSMDESRFFRGIAFSAGLKSIQLSSFFSYRNYNPVSTYYDSATMRIISFSSLDNTGYHRENKDLDFRNEVSEIVFGGCLEYQWKYLQAGIIGFAERYNADFRGLSRPYAIYYFSGDRNLILGSFTSLNLNKIRIITEFSRSKNGGTAWLAGVSIVPAPGVKFTLSYRNFGKDYQNLHGSGFMSGERNSNEKGVYIGIDISLPRHWQLGVSADASKMPWPSYQVDGPSYSVATFLMLEKMFSFQTSFRLTFRFDEQSINNPGSETFITETGLYQRYMLRLNFDYGISSTLSLKSRIEGNWCRLPPNENEHGVIIYQDVSFDIIPDKLKLWFRLSLFDSSDYESRIYSMERDVAYDFSSQSFYGQGNRTALMISYTPWKFLKIWMKAGSTIYENKITIGEGLEEIMGNHKTGLEIQLMFKW